jgi:TonB family protein
MNILQYIKGERKGKEINSLEKEAMKNPFLAEALEGFNKVENDNHESRIKEMRAEITAKTKSGNNHIVRYISIAASILLITGSGWYFLLNKVDSSVEYEIPEQQIAKNKTSVPNDTLPDNSPQEIKTQIEKPLIAHIKTKEVKPATKAPQVEITRLPIQDTTPSTEKEIAETKENDKIALIEANDTTPVVMEENFVSLDEVIVVGFGTQKRESVATANSLAATSEPLENKMADRIAETKPVSSKKEYEKYLKKNITPLQSETCKGKKGTVKLIFTIDSNGRPANIRIKKSLCPEADREAIRLIEQGPDWAIKDKEIEIKVKFK